MKTSSIALVLCALMPLVAAADGAVTVYVKTVAAGGSDAEGDGTSAKPYASPARAVAALGEDGGVVEIAAGTYALSEELFLSTPVTLHGASRETTILDVSGTEGVRCVLLSNANAKVVGLTLRGAHNACGGGVLMCGGRVEDCAVTGCSSSGTAKEYMGAIQACLPHAPDWTRPVVSRCYITNNTFNVLFSGAVNAHYGTGGIALDNCLIANNTGYGFNAHYSNNDNLCVFSNCTFVGNSVEAIRSYSNVLTVNCLICGAIYNNSPKDMACWSTCFSGSVTNGYAIHPGCILVEDPLFKDAAAGNYRLRDDSPCINAGMAVLQTLDLDRNARTSGGVPDMGCYERDFSSASCVLTWDRKPVFPGDPVNFTVTVIDDGAGRDYDYSVTFTERRGGIVSTNVASFSRVFAEAGLYDIAVEAVDKSDPDYRATYAFAAGFKVAALTNYVTKLSVTAGEWPYDAPEKATSDLGQALAETETGSVVAFLEGTHPLTEPVFLNRPVTLCGMAGRERTVLDASGTEGVSCVILSNANAKAVGLTLRGAHNACGGGVLMCGGRVEDCAVTGCSSSGTANEYMGAIQAGLPHAPDWTRPVVSRCYITNNTFNALYSGAVNANYATGGIALDNCLIADNAGYGFNSHYGNPEDACSFSNCTFAGNSGQAIRSNSGVLTVDCIVCGAFSNDSNVKSLWTCFSGSSTNGCKIREGCMLVEDPLFKNASAHNYRLRASSACMNAGCQEPWMADAKDLDGKPRVQGLPDMGCYERDRRGLAVLMR